MAEVTTGFRRILATPSVYNATQNLLGANRSREAVARDFLRAQAGDTILDMGCGTAEILAHLPSSVDYWGFDLSPAYVASARQRFGERGRFECADVNTYASEELLGRADLVIALGVLHHLDDDRVRALMKSGWRALKEGGRFVSIDPTFTPDQSRVSRFLVSRDRGLDVREPEEYAGLCAERFPDVQVRVVHNLPRVPYTHCVLEARKPAA